MKFAILIELVRPKQWIKNLMVFFPPFLSGALVQVGMVTTGLIPFFAFCCASSATYIFNDLHDLEQDALHPRKKLRPLVSGKISSKTAKLLLAALLISALLLGWLVSLLFLLYVVAYLMLTFAYSIHLKHVPIFDVFCISLGFVLRLYGGSEAFKVPISDWLFLTVFLLATFLSFGKRYSESLTLGDRAGQHRYTLGVYPEGFLEGALYLSGAAVLIVYAIYTITTPYLVHSVPLCMYGLLRYLMRIKLGLNGDPSESLIKDFPLLMTSLLWVLIVGWSIYR